ncbi:reverse transcriptase domain-containing protein [Tanacetum coccineum]
MNLTHLVSTSDEGRNKSSIKFLMTLTLNSPSPDKSQVHLSLEDKMDNRRSELKKGHSQLQASSSPSPQHIRGALSLGTSTFDAIRGTRHPNLPESGEKEKNMTDSQSPKKGSEGIYLEGGSSSKVMYEHCFRNLRAETKAKLKESRTPLVGFFGEVSYPIGTINLNVTMEEQERLRTIPMESEVVKSHSPYNVILGRTGLRSLGVVASTIYSMIKFPTANGIATMTTKRETLYEFQRMEEAQGPAQSGLIEMPHVDAFAWSPADMTGIPHVIAEHELKTLRKGEKKFMSTYQRANSADSVVLLVERDGGQDSIHYMSRTLQGAKINYPPMEKLVLALVNAARRLRRYFQSHTIKVITDKPIS